ncbi:MAG: DUF2892 domain-containing protein [Sulfurovaceae bacterium]|nr:DUF2892 domain-containing protein [Sulfurovaceae bacterium]MDD5548616.1 DUF2892 domain-containing protein [Sulfurovaceae bacterium]
MDIVKVEKICRPLRIVVGIILLALGFYTRNDWFLLGLIPLIVGIAGWRPFCKFTGKCSFKE